MVSLRMSCTQANIFLPTAGLFLKRPDPRLARTHHSLSQSSFFHVPSVYASANHKIQHYKASPRLIYNASKNKRCAHVCVYGGKGNLNSENEAFSWDSQKKATGGFRWEQSVEDLLRKQMQQQEFSGGGGGRNPPKGGGGDSGGLEDEKFAGSLDELLQVILATIGFIFVYICIIRGQELTLLARDYIKYLLGAKTSVRMRNAVQKWRMFFENLKEVRDDWLERAILAMPRWWRRPGNWSVR